MFGESEEAHRKDRLETSYSGVGQSRPIDPESPNLQPGNQGGAVAVRSALLPIAVVSCSW